MPGNFARTRSAELKLQLYERSVHPELLQIIRRAEVTERAYTATLAITGASHAVAVRTECETLTEVLSPPGAPLPRGGLRASVQLARGARDEIVRVEGALHYRGSFRVETYAPGEYRDVATRVLARDPFDRIKAFFDDEGAFDIPPFAMIDFRRRPRRLDAVSVHAYPHELTIVYVETRIDVAPG